MHFIVKFLELMCKLSSYPITVNKSDFSSWKSIRCLLNGKIAENLMKKIVRRYVIFSPLDSRLPCCCLVLLRTVPIIFVIMDCIHLPAMPLDTWLRSPGLPNNYTIRDYNEDWKVIVVSWTQLTTCPPCID